MKKFKEILVLDNEDSVIFNYDKINSLHLFEEFMLMIEEESTPTNWELLEYIIENFIDEYIDLKNTKKIDNKLMIKDILTDIRKVKYIDINNIISNILDYYTSYMKEEDKKK